MEEIIKHLKFFSELGVTHLNLLSPPPAASAQRSALSGQPPAVSGQRSAVSGQRSAVSAQRSSLHSLRDEIGDCTRCKLSQGRTNIVFGVGDPEADLMFVGEAPGEDEDLQGIPFVGRAGQLLTNIIKAIGLRREQVYIANILKCRPPKNRNPEPDEVAACSGFLMKQIDLIQPKIIVALGKYAAQTLLRDETPISRMRGKFFDYKGTLLVPTFHPSYLLRNPSAKKEVWIDMQAVRDRLKELGSRYYQ
ncbi:MAG: uracil-DNA glycosylase [Acidobacteriota bacterium]